MYREKLPASKTNITFIGEDRDQTILTYDDYASKFDSVAQKNFGTRNSASFTINASGFTARNFTFANAAGPVGQAVAVVANATHLQFINCRSLGYQDTLYASADGAIQYYRDCYIEGTVDFIFGSSTALFDSCTIFCKRGGYVTAASTPAGRSFGYVFRWCRITGDAPPASYMLGHPWRPAAQTVFIDCTVGSLIKPEGWFNWGKPENEKTAYYAEYHNKGQGADTSRRVPWSHQLTDQQASTYTTNAILDGWDPDLASPAARSPSTAGWPCN